MQDSIVHRDDLIQKRQVVFSRTVQSLKGSLEKINTLDELKSFWVGQISPLISESFVLFYKRSYSIAGSEQINHFSTLENEQATADTIGLITQWKNARSQEWINCQSVNQLCQDETNASDDTNNEGFPIAVDYQTIISIKFLINLSHSVYAVFLLENDLSEDEQDFLNLLLTQLHRSIELVVSRVLCDFDNNVKLSKREQDCLRWSIEGKSSWEISVILGLSERTVNFHFNNIIEKTNSVNRYQAIAKCIFTGLAQPRV